MAVDIRAEVSCSLGTLISGSFADDYLQGNGLIKTRGEVVLSGTQTPAVGTQVSFTYAKDGNTYTIPRVLRVLSSFADPFRRTTTVQLGCKLTYLENRKPPLGNPNSKEEHSAVPCYVFDRATLPISASYVLTECLSALGLSSGTIPLTNTFSIEEFDLTPGYVQVISDLLQSEGYVGYLDSDEELQFIDLTDETGTGPLIGTSEVIDLGPIGVGDLPGESVVVRYNSLRLRAPEDLQDDEFLKRRWEVEEVFGQAQEVSTSYENAAGTTITVSDFFYPYTFSGTLYDAWDRKVESVTLTTASSAEVNGRWASDAAKTGVSWNRATNRISHEVVQYAVSASVPAVNLLNELQANGATSLKQTLTALSLADSGTAAACVEDPPESYDQILSQTSTSYFSELELAGSLNIDSYTSQGNLISFGTVADLVNSQTTIGYEKDDASGITKTVTQQWLSRSQTVSGQQDLATLLANSTETDTSALIATLLAKASPVVYQNSEVQLHTQLQFGLQRRPSQADRNNTANLKPNVSEQKAELEWVMGSPTSTAVTEFSLPYAPDDQIGWTSVGGYTSTASDAAQKAQRYGRIQNKLLLGNRNGTSIQLAPEQLPKRPFDPLYLQAGGFTGAYRVNGTSWAFDANGIVASVDALLWGAVSASSGTSLASSWIPLAPDTSSLPTPYPVTPGTLDPETGVTFAAVIEPDTVIPPYEESVLAEGISRSSAVVLAYPYVLDRGSTEFAATTRTRLIVGSRVAADAGAVTVNGQPAGLAYRRVLIGARGTFALTGFGAGNVRDYSIGTNSGSFALAGKAAALSYGRAVSASNGSLALTGFNAGYIKGTIFAVGTGSFAVQGQAIDGVRGLVLSGVAGSVTLSGQDASLAMEDYFGKWATQTYGYEALVFPEMWAD